MTGSPNGQVPLPRTVILDYYDSYTNNLLTLFTKLYSDAEVLRKVVVIKADRYTWESFQSDVLPNIECVILSPGPGTPDNPADIGFALELLRQHSLPILGVCLGHQAIAVAFGAKIVNIPKITHGHVISVEPVQPSRGLFASRHWTDPVGNSDKFDVVVYNSLTVDPDTFPSELEVTAWSSPPEGEKKTIQGLRHKDHAIWGVQYHPESISSTRGAALLQAFVDEVHQYHHRPSTFPALKPELLTSCSYRVAAAPSLSRVASKINLGDRSGRSTPVRPMTPDTPPSLSRLLERRYGASGLELETSDVFERLIRTKGQSSSIGQVWLDGKTPTRPTTTSLAGPTFAITYCLSTRTVTLHRPGTAPSSTNLGDETFWDWFSAGQDYLQSQLDGGSSSRGGWRGGWVGWFSYEMKEEGLSGYKRRSTSHVNGQVQQVDACWTWSDAIVQRSPEGEWIARAVLEGKPVDLDEQPPIVRWLRELGCRFGITQREWIDFQSSVREVLEAGGSATYGAADVFPTFHPVANGEDYRTRIDACREAIRQGESYELTMTTRFDARLGSDDPYALYLRLRRHNPAYYSTFISLPGLDTPEGRGIHILSSSPERFLKIQDGEVEMMPIKGTRARIKPSQCVCTKGPHSGDSEAQRRACEAEASRRDQLIGEELQNDPKERAENLMIVDLIRSDLLSCCTPSTVTVPKLIALESYGVHNLVTTVRGRLAPNVGTVEAVKRCFPPGSMTGAPKLRSVQLLEGFEGQPRRGIYSGALGYIGLDGEADLSVVIRTMIVRGKQISIGAGGAITWLSDRDSEWQEVLTKVRSVVGTLEGVA